MISHVDVTRRRRSEEELVHQSSTDPVTGLINPLAFNRALATALQPGPAPTPDDAVGVISISLEGLRSIGGTYGDAAGDELLVIAAERLTALIRPQDTVSRVGSDRFAVCAPSIGAPALLAIADRISTTLARPYPVQGRELSVAVGVGSHLAVTGVDPADAIRAADRDLYDIEQLQQLAGNLPS